VKQSPVGTPDNSPPVSTVGGQFSDANKPRKGERSISLLQQPSAVPGGTCNLLPASLPTVETGGLFSFALRAGKQPFH
jgi:hypothetical protein